MKFSGQIKHMGLFTWQLHDKHGVVIDQGSFPNGMTTVGLNALASAELGGGTQFTTWYMGLIDNAGFSALAIGDTAASHTGWTELTGYSESTRQALTFGSPSGGIIATSSPCSFTANTSIAVKGAFIISNSAKSGTTGILRATGAFGSVQSLSSGQVLAVNYSSTYS